MVDGAKATNAALALIGITRRFGSVVALDNATMHVQPGTVHALLGENGAGKTTLMRVAFGLAQADAGSMELSGRAVRFSSPAAALAAGLGMVHQHFTLVPAMTVAENVALGGRGRFSIKEWAARVKEIGERTGLVLDPFARVSDLSVGAQQRCEIVKALARDVRVLILDEPTAVLAPGEALELLQWVKNFANAGHAVVLITHKLRDALAIASNVTVLRRGQSVLNASVSDTTESQLAAAMLGSSSDGSSQVSEPESAKTAAVSDVLVETRISEPASQMAITAHDFDMESRNSNSTSNASASSPINETHSPQIDATFDSLAGREVRSAGGEKRDFTRVVLRLSDVTSRDKRDVVRVNRVSLVVHAGEIVGVAAVEGAGQRELLRLLSGRIAQSEGDVQLPAHIGFVPEDRHQDALMLDRSLVENVALRDAGSREGRMPWNALQQATRTIINELQVVAGGAEVEARTLSGGNQQKLIVGRELADRPEALVVENPTRGLDFRSASAVHDALRSARAYGTAIVVYSSDLDEVLALSDRVVVMHAGQLLAVDADRDAIGRAMLGA